MAKVTRGSRNCGFSGFFYGAHNTHNRKELHMQETAKIISYRRRCQQTGQGTGLSHYLLLTPKIDKK